jgi:hypothetical protein
MMTRSGSRVDSPAIRRPRLTSKPRGPSAALERVIARACALLPDPNLVPGRVIPFVPRQAGPVVRVLAQWGSLAAAIALAGWLGFSMGSDTSLALTPPQQPGESSFLPDFFDAAPGFLRDLGDSVQT